MIDELMAAVERAEEHTRSRRAVREVEDWEAMSLPAVEQMRVEPTPQVFLGVA